MARADSPDADGQTQELIERFCEALWLEDGLAENTIVAYRRDLRAVVQWLAENALGELADIDAEGLHGYIAARHANSKATSGNRRLSVLRRFSDGWFEKAAVRPIRPNKFTRLARRRVSEDPVRNTSGSLAVRTGSKD